MGLSSLEKKRLHGNWIVIFHCLKGDYKKDKDTLFSRVFYDKTWCSGFKLKEGIYKEKSFMKRGVKQWNKLPRGVVYTPTLETFEAMLDEA